MTEQFFKAVRNKDGSFASEPLVDRFWRQVDKTATCWIWTGVRSHAGHGRISFNGKYMQATHVALMLAGVEVPPGAFACHHCDNPPCVRPDHLYVGDPKSNVRDMFRRGRNRSKGIPRMAARGQRNHNAKLTDEQVLSIRAAYTGRRGEQTALAHTYGVTPQLIQMIVKGAHRG